MRFLISRAVILLSALILAQQELAEAQKLEDAASKVNLENINGLEFLNLLVEKLRNCERNASTSSNNLASELEKARKEVIKLTAANQNLTIELGNLRRDFKLGVRTNATSPKKPNNLTLNGYVETPGLGTYKIYTTAKNWTDAKRACDRDGAYLGVPNSEAEAKLFAGMTSRALTEIKEASDPRYAWVGVSDRLEEGRWVTVFGNSINSTGFYNHWMPNLSHGTSFNCGALMDLTEPVGLIDWRCADKFAYICEF